MLAALEATLVIAGPEGARREIPVSHLLAGRELLAPAELIGHVRVPLLHAPQVFLKATGRTGPGRATASVAVVLDPARRGVRCAVGAIAPMPLRPLEAEGWIASLIDWDGERAALAPEALTAFGEYVAAACIPDPVPAADGTEPPRCRPPYCTCGARSPRWPDEHWGGRCRERQPRRRPTATTARAGRAAGNRFRRAASTTTARPPSSSCPPTWTRCSAATRWPRRGTAMCRR